MSASPATARNYERWAKTGKPWMARRLCRTDAGHVREARIAGMRGQAQRGSGIAAVGILHKLT